MIDYIRNFELNGLLGILLYWVPMLFCAVFYTVRTAEGYMRDRQALEQDRAFRAAEKGDACRRLFYYQPSETVGSVICRALVSIIPIANIWAAAFDLSPKVFSRLFGWIGRVFNQPLVPKDKRPS